MIQLTITSESFFPLIKLMEEKADYLKFKKGQIIYSEGSTPLGAYFVQTGKAKIIKRGSDGKEQIIRIATPEEMLSFTDLLSKTRYSTSATALEDTTLLFINKADFWTLMRENKDVCEKFVLLVSSELKEAELKIADLAYKPVRGRLADSILFLSQKFNGNAPGKSSLTISRSDLAGYVGTAKETINRFISEFRHDKYIATEGKRIDIINFNALNHVATMYN
jgi:CRP/FNR family transcriptional regulator, polysaccharide utilization system transcription regulator